METLLAILKDREFVAVMLFAIVALAGASLQRRRR